VRQLQPGIPPRPTILFSSAGMIMNIDIEEQNDEEKKKKKKEKKI
jgi:hypothetical protein